MKTVLIASVLLISAGLSAQEIPLDQQISSIEVTEITDDSANKNILPPRRGSSGYRGSYNDRFNPNDPTDPTDPRDPRDPRMPGPYQYPYPHERPDRVEQTRNVIGVAREVVALGEAVYELITKGKPKITTSYEPISVVPRDPMSKEIVDPFDLSGFSLPVERNFLARVKNGAGKEVVQFKYKLMYSYGGSLDGKGRYITGLIIVPGQIKAKWGWTIDSSMKLSGIMNHGTKENPIAGAVITIKYSISSFTRSFERNDTIHVTGTGQAKTYVSR